MDCEHSAQTQVVETWSEWRRFPDPRRGDCLVAPIGPGAFEVRHASTKERLILATANSVAARLSSLLPGEIRPVLRETSSRRQYLGRYIEDLEYRVFGSPTRSTASAQVVLMAKRRDYRFGLDI